MAIKVSETGWTHPHEIDGKYCGIECNALDITQHLCWRRKEGELRPLYAEDNGRHLRHKSCIAVFGHSEDTKCNATNANARDYQYRYDAVITIIRNARNLLDLARDMANSWKIDNHINISEDIAVIIEQAEVLINDIADQSEIS